MNLVQVDHLTKSYGDRLLFGDVSFGINEGDKIGLIAKNGTGKSTLLRILAGEEDSDSGEIVFRNGLRVGYLAQTPDVDESGSVLDACPPPPPDEHGEVDWTYHDRLTQILTQLGLTDLNAQVATLSGGQKKRIALAKLILSDPQLLILDEPTNHLDIEVIEWLEQYLKRSRATILMVTHDRYFLDRVCSKNIEIDRKQIYTYEGNYDYYLRRRAERIEAMQAELDSVRNLLRREQDWMNRQPQARATKAKARIDAFYDLRERSRVNLQEKNIRLEAKSSYIGSKIFEAEGVSKRFGDKVILNDFTYTFARYEKVGIVGPNGVGKSTFIKLLQGLIPADSGQWNLGETVRFGYYSQDGLQFDSRKRVVDIITDIAEEVHIPGASQSYSPMQFLQHFLFTPLDQQKYVHTLSGGELARLHLAAVLVRQPNFLILDEPTNDLDIVTLSILEDWLRGFKGCVIVVSHDRYFLDEIVDHLFVFQGDGVIKDFPGNYTEYREFMQRKAKEAAETAKSGATVEKPRRQRTQRPQRLSYKEQRELEALEKEIEQLQAEKTDLEALFNNPPATDTPEMIAERSLTYERVCARLDEAEMRWLELDERR